ncbi:MAG: diadenylate cyclase CdaA [Bacteroidales bacterium]
MLHLFITVRFLDVLDILLVTFLMYQFYSLVRGTVAINIFVTIFSIYLVWYVTKALNMQLLSSILGQVIGVGIIALVVVFQPEIRRFLLLMGTRYMSRKFGLQNLFLSREVTPQIRIKEIARACNNMSKNKTGALIVIERNSALQLYAESGVIINATTTSPLIESIFFKNNPLHDGAIIIVDEKIFAARCILPISERTDLPAHFGLRHRAGLGITELTDCLAIIVSEESGQVSVAENGQINANVSLKTLMKHLNNLVGGH